MNRLVMTFLFLTMSAPFTFGLLCAAKEATGDDLNLSLADLLDFKITVASKTEEKISDAPGVISVVTQDELKRFGGTTLGDILTRVPSLLGSTSYLPDRQMISSRGDQVGVTANHILLLLNGRPMREDFTGGIKSEVLESFPVNVIERIEVIRGPGSVLYGSQAFSGVINIVTKSAGKNAATVTGELGNGLKNNIATDLQYQSGDFGLVVAGRYANKGGWDLNWEAPGLKKIYSNPVTIPDYGPGGYAELNYKDLRLMCSYNQWQNQSFISDVQWFRDVPAIGVSDVTGQVTWKKLFGDLGYRHKFTDWYNSSVNFTYTRSWFAAHEFPKNSRDSYEALCEWTNFISLFEHCSITAGATMGWITGTEGDINNDTLAYNRGVYNKGHIQNNFSGYAQIDYRWTWCKAIGGLQVNKSSVSDSLGHTDAFKADVNPRAGLIFYPLEHINIKALYSTAYRAPSINELYINGLTMKGKMVRQDDITWYPGHDYSLDPEKVNTYDVGVNYQDNKVEFGINGFYSLMKNLIFQRAISSSVSVWDNMGQITISGLECEGKYYLTKSLLFEGSFLFQQNRDAISGSVDVTPIPNFSAKGGLSYQSESGLTMSIFNEFQQAPDLKYSSTLNKTTGYINMANVHCSYDFNKLFHASLAQELSLVSNVDNFLNQEIWLPAWGLDPGSTIPYNQGRTIYAGFKVAF